MKYVKTRLLAITSIALGSFGMIGLASCDVPLSESETTKQDGEDWLITFLDVEGLPIFDSPVYAENNNSVDLSVYQAAEAITESRLTEGWAFQSWTVAPSTMIRQDTVIQALKSVKILTVAFMDTDGSVFEAVRVAYGTDAQVPAMQPIGSTGSLFMHWQGNYTEVTEDRFIYPLFSKADSFVYQDVEYYAVEQGLVIKSIPDVSEGLSPVINGKVNGVPVVGIGAGAASGKTVNLPNLLPSEIEFIAFKAFCGAEINFSSPLTETFLPINIKDIDDYAFENAITNYSWANPLRPSLVSLRQYAFSGCKTITGNIVIPEAITVLHDGIFKDSTITGLQLHDRITSIGKNAFYNCKKLVNSLQIPADLQTIGEFAFYECSSLLGQIVIPEAVTIIPTSAFDNCSKITYLKLHDYITEIHFAAFWKLYEAEGEFEFPANIQVLGDQPFARLRKMTGLPTFPTNINIVPDSLFFQAYRLSGVILHDNITTIKSFAFELMRDATVLDIPTGVTSIGQRVFNECRSLPGDLVIPSSVTTLNYRTFRQCYQLTSVTFLGNITAFRDEVFADCTGITTPIDISKSKTIGARAFMGMNLAFSGQTIVIPASVTSIGDGAFTNIDNLTIDVSLVAAKVPSFGLDWSGTATLVY